MNIIKHMPQECDVHSVLHGTMLTARNKAIWFINSEPLITTVQLINMFFKLCWYLRVTLSWDAMPCSPRDHYQHFGRTYWVSWAWRKVVWAQGQGRWSQGPEQGPSVILFFLPCWFTQSCIHFPYPYKHTTFFHTWLFSLGGVRLSPLGTSANVCLLYQPRMIDGDEWWLWSSWWNEDWHGKPKYSEKTFPSATLSTTNPTWPDMRSNPGRRGGKPATNRLSYGTASTLGLLFYPEDGGNWFLWNVGNNLPDTTWHHDPEDSNHHGHCYENLKCHMFIFNFI
jgi:hypothetical protein